MWLWCYNALILIFLKPNYGNAMACSMMCVDYWLLFLSSLLMWSWGVCIWDTWLNHFWVIDQLYLIFFPVALRGLKCLNCSWWCHIVTCLTWPFWSLRSILFWDTFWLLVENWWILWFILGYFLIAHWEPMDIVIYHLMPFSCSLRIVVIITIIF